MGALDTNHARYANIIRYVDGSGTGNNVVDRKSGNANYGTFSGTTTRAADPVWGQKLSSDSESGASGGVNFGDDQAVKGLSAFSIVIVERSIVGLLSNEGPGQDYNANQVILECTGSGADPFYMVWQNSENVAFSFDNAAGDTFAIGSPDTDDWLQDGVSSVSPLDVHAIAMTYDGSTLTAVITDGTNVQSRPLAVDSETMAATAHNILLHRIFPGDAYRFIVANTAIPITEIQSIVSDPEYYEIPTIKFISVPGTLVRDSQVVFSVRDSVTDPDAGNTTATCGGLPLPVDSVVLNGENYDITCTVPAEIALQNSEGDHTVTITIDGEAITSNPIALAPAAGDAYVDLVSPGTLGGYTAIAPATGHQAVYSLSSAPDGLVPTLGPSGDVIAWDTEPGQDQTFDVRIIAADGTHYPVESYSFTIPVIAVTNVSETLLVEGDTFTFEAEGVVSVTAEGVNLPFSSVGNVRTVTVPAVFANNLGFMGTTISVSNGYNADTFDIQIIPPVGISRSLITSLTGFYANDSGAELGDESVSRWAEGYGNVDLATGAGQAIGGPALLEYRYRDATDGVWGPWIQEAFNIGSGPIVTAPDDTTLQFNFGGAGLAKDNAALLAWMATATANDAEDGALSPAGDLSALADPIPAGVYNIPFTVNDSDGLTGSDVAQLTVEEAADTNTAPTLTVPGDTSLEFAFGGAGLAKNNAALLAWIATASGADAEDGAITPVADLSGFADPIPAGVHTIPFSVTDSGGLTDSGTAQLTVAEAADPNTAPALTVPANTSLEFNFGGAGLAKNNAALLAWIATASGTDAEDGAITPVADLSGLADPIPAGVHTIPFLVTDSGGLTDSGTAQLTVAEAADPNTAPTLTLPGAITLQFAFGGAGLAKNDAALLAWIATASGADAEDGAITPVADLSGLADPIPAGVYSVPFLVTDSGGLTDSGNVQLTVSQEAADAEVVSDRVAFMVDYREAQNPTIYAVKGGEVIAQEQLTTSGNLVFFARNQWDGARDYFARANVGQDTLNSPMRAGLDAALASLGVNPRSVRRGWGDTHSADHLYNLPVITLHTAPEGVVGQPVELTAQCLDGQGNDVSEQLRWFNLGESWNRPEAFSQGASYSFTPRDLGYYPILVEYTDVHGRLVQKRVAVMVNDEVPTFGIQRFDDTLSHPNVAELVNNQVRFGSATPAGLLALVNQGLWGAFQYFELTLEQTDNAGTFGFGLSSTLNGAVAGGRFDVNTLNDGAGTFALLTQQAASDTVRFYVNGATLAEQISNLVFAVDGTSTATKTLGFAVDYRDKSSNPVVHVVGYDQNAAAGRLLGSVVMRNTFSPVHPMVYCLAAGNTAQGQLDASFNGGAQAFVYDARAILAAADVDVAGFENGWGVDAI